MSFEPESNLYRRSIVRTGAKLMYAAPLVAASMSVHSAGATPVSGAELICSTSCHLVLTRPDGTSYCIFTTLYDDVTTCCSTDADCRNEPDAHTCIASLQGVSPLDGKPSGSSRSIACLTDASKGVCRGYVPC